MNADDLTARVQRLEQLYRGMCRELWLWKADSGPLEFGERKAYLNAIHDVIAGTEAARVVLLGAWQRLDEQAQRLRARQTGDRG